MSPLHSTRATAGLHQSPITLACFVPLKKKTTTKTSNPPPAEQSMEFLTKLSESYLMVQQALMQSHDGLSYRSNSVWLYTRWLDYFVLLETETNKQSRSNTKAKNMVVFRSHVQGVWILWEPVAPWKSAALPKSRSALMSKPDGKRRKKNRRESESGWK